MINTAIGSALYARQYLNFSFLLHSAHGLIHSKLWDQLSLAIPSWVGSMSTNQRAVTPCGWGVMAGMVRVWVACITVWSHCYTRVISERFRDKEL